MPGSITFFTVRVKGGSGKVVWFMGDSGFFYEIERPDEWEMNRIPPPLAQSWHDTHRTVDCFLHHPNTELLSKTLRKVWEFEKTVKEHCPLIEITDIEQALDRFTHSVELWDDDKIQTHIAKLERVLEQIVAQLHLRATKSLDVHQEAWYYRVDKSQKPLSRKDVTHDR